MTEVSIRDLRNHGGEIVDRAGAGERIIITRSGRPVAELVPLRQGRPTPEQLIERWKHLPPLDPQQLRDEVDSIIDPSL